MNTDHLIERLAQDLPPAPALRPPWVRAGWWLLGAIAYLGALTLMMTSRADVEANGTGWRFMLPQVAALATAAAAAAAALASTVPGSSRRALWLPAIAATVWIGSLVAGAVQEWGLPGSAGLAAPREWRCVAMIVAGGVLPALAMLGMLRHGAPLTPRLTAALAVLAAAGLANVGACLSHPHPSSATTLAWHGATILALLGLAVWSGRAMLGWERVRQSP